MANADQNADSLKFRHALYYPFIDITDDRWLLTSLLYWEDLSTIVPTGLRPYRSGAARVAHDAGLLRPAEIDPSAPEVLEAGEKMLGYLGSPESVRLLDAGAHRQGEAVSLAKMSMRLQRAIVHRHKMSGRMRRELRMRFGNDVEFDDWIRLPPALALHYMTVLAAATARHRGRSLVTNLASAEGLAERSMRGEPVHPTPAQVTEGLLASMIFESVEVGADVDPKKLIRFRERRSGELGRLRAGLRKLAAEVNKPQRLDLLQRHCETVFVDDVRPAISELRQRLRENRISVGLGTVKASAFMSAGPTAIGIALTATGIAGPWALAAGAGFSMMLSAVNYGIRRREILRGSPFSYVLAAERALGRRRSSRR